MTREYARIVAQERLILDAAEVIYALMQRHDVTKAELARRLGKSRGHVTQVLGGRNITLRTLADVGYALGERIEIGYQT